MKTMIQVRSVFDNGKSWVALDSIKSIVSHKDYCLLSFDDKSYFLYMGTIEQLAAATRSSADPRGEMRLIRMEENVI